MSLEFGPHTAALASLPPPVLELVQSSWSQARKAFGGDEGLHLYVDGIRALAASEDVIAPLAAFVRGAPDIAEEVGHASVSRLIAIVPALRAHAGPDLLELVMTASVVAARRLADPQLFSGF